MKRTEVRRWVLVQFEIRRRRWLISAQGSSLREPWGHHINDVLTLKGFANRQTLSGFACFRIHNPGLSLRSNRWAEISQRLRRIQTGQYTPLLW